MKKLYLSLVALLCCAALATPVFADIPADRSASLPDLWPYLLIGVAVLAAGFILYRLLRKRNK